jgi:hypothetical protein
MYPQPAQQQEYGKNVIPIKNAGYTAIRNFKIYYKSIILKQYGSSLRIDK